MPGFSLSEAGRSQAARTAEFLRSQRAEGVHIVTSPLERARETAEILHRELTTGADAPVHLRTDERLIEAGTWREGLPYAFDAAAYFRRLRERTAHTNESPREIALRMRAALLDALRTANDDEMVIVVSHQSPIRLALVAVEHHMGTPHERWLPRMFPWALVKRSCGYASVTTLSFTEGAKLSGIGYWEPR
jgi:broad specificity phosphatase PhoE